MIFRPIIPALLAFAGLACACGAPVAPVAGGDATAADGSADADASVGSDGDTSSDVPLAQDTISNDSLTVDVPDVPNAPDVSAADTGPACTVVTFATVKEVINNHCTPCHSWASSCSIAKNSVQQVLGATGFMPPGGQNKMSEDEKAVLQQWIDDGKLCSSPGCP